MSDSEDEDDSDESEYSEIDVKADKSKSQQMKTQRHKKTVQKVPPKPEPVKREPVIQYQKPQVLWYLQDLRQGPTIWQPMAMKYPEQPTTPTCIKIQY